MNLYNEDTEKAVLGCILTSPECAVKAPSISLAAFYNATHRVVLKAILDLLQEGKGADSITVSQRLKECCRYSPPDGWLYFLNTIEDTVATPVMFDSYVKEVSELHQRRQAIEVSERIRQLATDTSIPVETIPADIESAVAVIRNVTGTAKEDEFRRILEQRRFNVANKPPESRPIYQLAGVPIATPGNIATITAQAKTGKSALIGAMISAAISPVTALDTLGVKSCNPSGGALLHFDTEQAPDDHWSANDRALRRAGVQVKPDWFESFYLTGISTRQLLGLITFEMKEAKAKFGSIHSVLIDGFADLAEDVNDAGESNKLVSDLHALAIEYDCPIIGVIHLNPNSEKTRGHLGSQLERKSETNLILQKEGEVTCMWSVKQRRAPILKETAPRFRWSDEAGMHVTCASAKHERDAEKVEQFKLEIDDVFSETPSMRYADLKTTIKKTLRVSDPTAERRIKDWSKYHLITKTSLNFYQKAT
ncbi:MAG: DnaB-like helicase N-terminal domain-containing protein [Limisphaerales bacterium]